MECIKAGPPTRAAKTSAVGGYRERVTVCHGIICDSFLDTISFHSHFIPDYFPDPSDSSSCFSLLIWSSERTAITTSYLQLFFSFVTLATQSCHQLLGVGCPVSICKLLFIETMLGTSFLLTILCQ